MYTILIGLTLMLGIHAKANAETEEAKKSLRALITPILQRPVKDPKTLTKDFSVAKCEKHQINWMEAILKPKSVALTYTFRPGCDIEGTVYPTIFKPFITNLKLKNLHNFHHLSSENKITASLEALPIIYLEIRSAKLSGTKGDIKFDADYSVRINPAKTGDPIQENLGGEIRIKEIYGKPVTIKERIMIE